MSYTRLLTGYRGVIPTATAFATALTSQQRISTSQCAWFTSSSSPSRESSTASTTDVVSLKKNLGKKSPAITVYQYKICPFCNRVKAYLDYLNIPYRTIEVNPLTKGEISFSKDYKKVPLVTFDDTQVNDSTPILAHITDNLVSSKRASDVGFFSNDTDKWSTWSEKKLAVMLYPNITRSMSESWECFGYTEDVLEWNPLARVGTRIAGAAAMTLANGKIKSKYNIVDERAELDAVIKEWVDAVAATADTGPFLHGNTVTLPDLMVFGVLRSIEGLSTWNEIMTNNPKLKSWYTSVNTVVPSCEMGSH